MDSAHTLFNVLPAIETLHKEWSNQIENVKYAPFKEALVAGLKKLEDYYKKTADSDAHIISMGVFFLFSLFGADVFCHPVLHLAKKMKHFKEHWDLEEREAILDLVKKVVWYFLLKFHSTQVWLKLTFKMTVLGVLWKALFLNHYSQKEVASTSREEV